MKTRLVHIHSARHILAALTLLAIDVAFFSLVNPNKVASSVLIIGFGLVTLTIYMLVRTLMHAITLYGLVKIAKSNRVALFISVGLGLWIALQSIGELTARDIVVTLLLELIAYVYVSYGRKRRNL